MKNAVVAILCGAVLVGCANLPSGAMGGGSAVAINGYAFQPTTEASFHLGRFQGLPRPRSLSDLHEMDRVIATYASSMKTAKAKHDVASFAILETMGAQLLGFRAAIALQSVKAFQQAKSNHGMASIPANGYVVLPAMKDQVAQPAKTASYSKGSLMANAPTSYSSARVNLAMNANDITSLSNTVGDGLRTAIQISTQIKSLVNSGGATQAQAQASLNNAIRPGIPYVGVDGNGQQFVVEREGDSFILHNPTGKAVKLNLEKLGYLPPVSAPSVTQQNAAPILVNLTESANGLFKSLGSRYDVRFHQPNRLEAQGYGLYTDTKGNITKDSQVGAIGYKTNKVYRFAADTEDRLRNGPEFEQFGANCNGESGRYWRRYYHGTFAQVVEFACIEVSGDALVYSQSYFVNPNPKSKSAILQTWSSMMQDKDTQDMVNNALAISDGAEAIMTNIPFFGNLDAAIGCAFGETGVQKFLNAVSPTPKDLGRFVGNSTDISSVERGLACGSAIPLFGEISTLAGFVRTGKVTGTIQDGLGVTRLAKLFGVSEDSVVRAAKLSEIFDTKLINQFNREAYSHIAELTDSNAAAYLAKHLYDMVQKGYNLKGLGQSAGEVWGAAQDENFVL